MVRAGGLFDDGAQLLDQPGVRDDLEIVEHDRGVSSAVELREQGLLERGAHSRRAIAHRQQLGVEGTAGGCECQPEVASEPARIVVLGPEREPHDPLATARLGPLSQQHRLAVAGRGDDGRQPLPLGIVEQREQTRSAEGAGRQHGPRRRDIRRATGSRACPRRSHIAPSSRERPAIPQPR